LGTGLAAIALQPDPEEAGPPVLLPARSDASAPPSMALLPPVQLSSAAGEARAAEPGPAPTRIARALFEPPRRRRSDPSSGPRLRRILADQSNQPVASGLLHLDPILVALADSERHFRTLIEQAADGIVVVDSVSGRATDTRVRTSSR
jgi:hypothetical protein